MSWNNYNDADDQTQYDIIPKGTVAKVRMTIKPGGYDDPNQGWTGGYATSKPATGSVYLSAEFVILEGKYAKRKIWSLIGLHSPKGPDWADMGRAFIKGILNSSRGILPKDNSPEAQQARCIKGFQDLDGIEFLARIDIGEDANGEEKNEIRIAVTPDKKEYKEFMGNVAPHVAQPNSQPVQHNAPQTPPAQASTTSSEATDKSSLAKPAWLKR